MHLPESCSFAPSVSSTHFLICSPRLAAVRPGPHGPRCGLLLHLLPGFSGSALHHVQRRTLLFHRTLPGICRCLKSYSIKHIKSWQHFIVFLFHRLLKIFNFYKIMQRSTIWYFTLLCTTIEYFRKLYTTVELLHTIHYSRVIHYSCLDLKWEN